MPSRRRRLTALVLALALPALLPALPPAAAAERFITVASTTSTETSGLFTHLLPIFSKDTGIEVRVVAVGTGQALKIAERGDADALLVHHTPSEDRFVADGFGVERFDVMCNDFVIVGPKADPAGIRGGRDAVAALEAVAAKGAAFASRGDDSGTHKLELALWKEAGVDVKPASGGWYRETGSGMGAALNTASGLAAYALTDRGTWLGFANKGDLQVVVEGDRKLFNQYGVILVNPARHPHVKRADGQAFVDWLRSPKGQQAIAAFKVGGETLFHPNAKPAGT
jgi:tungstate transport system substrate-binding protein